MSRFGRPVSAPGQAVAGDLVDDDGNLLIGAGLNATTGGLGPAIRRYITSGVYNGDFALAPPSAGAPISDTTNPLPFWTFTQAGGNAITAQSVEDSGSGSGRVLEFQMAEGIAGDDSYTEQLIPINASRSQAYCYRARVAFLTDGTVSVARLYVKAAYIRNDAVTTTGTEGVREATTTSIGASTVIDVSCAPGTADGFIGGQVPADAYFIRLRVGFKRDVAATTVTEILSILESHLLVGPSELMIEDVTTPGNQPARLVRQAGVTLMLGRGSNAVGGAQSPAVTLTDSTEIVGIRGGFAFDTIAGSTTNAVSSWDSTNRGLLVGDSVRAKPVTPVGFAVRAVPPEFPSTDGFTTALNMAAVSAGLGGAVAIPINVIAPMFFNAVTVRNTDAASLRTAEGRLYLSRLNDSGTINFVTGTDVTWSFTPGAASNQAASPASAVLLAAGTYWLVIRNTSAAQTFGVGNTAVTTMGRANRRYQTIAALGATIDIITGWSDGSNVPGVILSGLEPDGVGTW